MIGAVAKKISSSVRPSSARLPPERPGQPGGKRDRNRRRRIEQLRQAGLKLFLERGVDQVTIDDIAKAAGTAKGNFYRYFTDKSDLVTGIIEPLADGLSEAFEACEEALEEASDDTTLFAAYQVLAMRLIPISIEHPDVVRLYLQESRAPAAGARAPIRQLADDVRERAVSLSQFAVDHGLLRTNPIVSSIAVVGAVEHLSWVFLSDGLEVAPTSVAGSLISLVLHGIGGAEK